MFYQVVCLVVATVLAIEATIELPGLENLQKCAHNDEACIIAVSDKINKAISKPYAAYSIQGYDPILVKELVVERADYQLTENFTDLEVTGLGDTKTISVKLAGEKDARQVTVTYEHNLQFAGHVRIAYHVQPELTREGSVSGKFVGLRSQFSYEAGTVEIDGARHLQLGPHTLLALEVPSAPEYDAEQFQTLTSDPETADIIKKIKENSVDFHKGLAEGIMLNVAPQFFEDRRNFYKHVLLSDLIVED